MPRDYLYRVTYVHTRLVPIVLLSIYDQSCRVCATTESMDQSILGGKESDWVASVINVKCTPFGTL